MNALYGRALLEWPIVVAAVTLFGTSAFILLVPGDEREIATAALVPLWRAMAVLTLLLSPLAVVDVTAEMAGVSWEGAVPLVREAMTQTHAGRVWEWFLPTAFLLIVATLAPVSRRTGTAIVLGAASVLLLLEALLSHAIDKGRLAVAIYFVHEVAAGLWLGGLSGLWIVVRRSSLSEIWIEQAARRVSKVAFWSVCMIVMSGIYTAYNGLGLDLDHLLYSAYGRTLMAKVAVFGVVLSIGAYNRYRLISTVHVDSARDALLFNVGIESLILAVGVLGLASLLANTPPAHGGAMAPGMMMGLLPSPLGLKAGATEKKSTRSRLPPTRA
jgi:putative copper export protein